MQIPSQSLSAQQPCEQSPYSHFLTGQNQGSKWLAIGFIMIGAFLHISWQKTDICHQWRSALGLWEVKGPLVFLQQGPSLQGPRDTPSGFVVVV